MPDGVFLLKLPLCVSHGPGSYQICARGGQSLNSHSGDPPLHRLAQYPADASFPVIDRQTQRCTAKSWQLPNIAHFPRHNRAPHSSIDDRAALAGMTQGLMVTDALAKGRDCRRLHKAAFGRGDGAYVPLMSPWPCERLCPPVLTAAAVTRKSNKAG